MTTKNLDPKGYVNIIVFFGLHNYRRSFFYLFISLELIIKMDSSFSLLSSESFEPSAKKKKVYQQKFRYIWKLANNRVVWLEEARLNPYQAYCKICGTYLTAKLVSIDCHEGSKAHVKNYTVIIKIILSIFDINICSIIVKKTLWIWMEIFIVLFIWKFFASPDMNFSVTSL